MKKLALLCGERDVQFEAKANRASGPIRTFNDAQVLRDWKPSLSLDEAIAWTIQWWNSYDADPASAWRVTESQIDAYTQLAVTRPTFSAASKS